MEKKVKLIYNSRFDNITTLEELYNLLHTKDVEKWQEILTYRGRRVGILEQPTLNNMIDDKILVNIPAHDLRFIYSTGEDLPILGESKYVKWYYK